MVPKPKKETMMSSWISSPMELTLNSAVNKLQQRLKQIKNQLMKTQMKLLHHQ